MHFVTIHKNHWLESVSHAEWVLIEWKDFPNASIVFIKEVLKRVPILTWPLIIKHCSNHLNSMWSICREKETERERDYMIFNACMMMIVIITFIANLFFFHPKIPLQIKEKIMKFIFNTKFVPNSTIIWL